MGHAGAIIGEGKFGTYESKVEAFERAGVKVAKTSEDLIAFVERAMPRRRQDFEAAMSKEFELVSISKQKLENLKSQVRAVQIRTHLTHIIDGMPYFRGRPLPQLMRQASVPQMIYEALTKEDDGAEQAAQLAQRPGPLRHDQSDRRSGPAGGRGFVPRRLADERRRQRRPVDHRRLGQQAAARQPARPLLARRRPTPWRWCRR